MSSKDYTVLEVNISKLRKKVKGMWNYDWVAVMGIFSIAVMAVGLVKSMEWDSWFGLPILVVGLVMFVSSAYFLIQEINKVENDIQLNITEELEATLEDLIIEEVDADKYTMTTDSSDLRKVYYKGKTYLFEFSGSEIIKFMVLE